MEQKSNISASDLFSPILNAYNLFLIFVLFMKPCAAVICLFLARKIEKLNLALLNLKL